MQISPHTLMPLSTEAALQFTILLASRTKRTWNALHSGVPKPTEETGRVRGVPEILLYRKARIIPGDKAPLRQPSGREMHFLTGRDLVAALPGKARGEKNSVFNPHVRASRVHRAKVTWWIGSPEKASAWRGGDNISHEKMLPSNPEWEGGSLAERQCPL